VFIPTNIYGLPVRSWLEWWIRLDEQVAKLKVTDGMEAGPNQGRWLPVKQDIHAFSEAVQVYETKMQEP
jgi:hypothetical protein